jgi:3-hydroxyisobutyrate dehydrogenase-like beta-hydroxyacid dehydrogenase
VSIGFIGLGNIGKPMALQLLKLGEELWVYDVAQAPVAELSTRGARCGAHARELAAHCRIIGLCVRDETDVGALLHGPEGLLAHMAADTIIAVHSTVAQAPLLGWAAAARQRGIWLIDAPITGGASAAQAATLTYMVGGERHVIERCRPLFMTSGQKLIHAGAVGAGILLKLCNNLMTYAALAAVHEAERLARAGGLDPALLIEVGHGNGVITAQMEAFLNNRSKLGAAGGQALQLGFAPFAALARKDLAAALASARELHLRLPATERVDELIEKVFLNQDN